MTPILVGFAVNGFWLVLFFFRSRAVSEEGRPGRVLGTTFSPLRSPEPLTKMRRTPTATV